MADEELWFTTLNRRTQARHLTRLERTGDQWRATALVVVADEITSRVLKDIKMIASTARMGHGLSDLQPPQIRSLTASIEAAFAAADLEDEGWTPPPRETLTRPDGKDPERHASAVAAAYREAVRMGRSPAREIAGEAAVPVPTARGWIQEARRRGHLGKGRRGRAGEGSGVS